MSRTVGCPPALEILAASMPYIVADRIWRRNRWPPEAQAGASRPHPRRLTPRSHPESPNWCRSRPARPGRACLPFAQCPPRPPAIVLSVPLTPCSVSHRASGRADGSWADVNGPSRFGLIAARLRWKRPARMPSLDRLARGRFDPACAGRFSTVKYNLDPVGTTNRASGSLAPPIRTRGTPWVERGSQLACAALIASHAPI